MNKDCKKEQLDDNSEERNFITEIKADLFTCSDDFSLAHRVSKDLAMGKGIATIFKQKFRSVRELKSQRKNVGEVAYLSDNRRMIFYLITKEKYYQKPTYKDLSESLLNMKELVIVNKIDKLAMPKIGCGLDRMKWTKVRKMIYDTFCDLDIQIEIYYL